VEVEHPMTTQVEDDNTTQSDKTYYVEGIVRTQALCKVKASNPEEAKQKVEEATEEGFVAYGNIEIEPTGFRKKEDGAEEDFEKLSKSQGVI